MSKNFGKGILYEEAFPIMKLAYGSQLLMEFPKSETFSL